MKYKYLIFGFSNYYPGGGMNDCKYKTNTKKELKNFVKLWAKEYKGKDYEHLHVYDAMNDCIIYEAEFDVRDYLDKDARELVIKTNEL